MCLEWAGGARGVADLVVRSDGGDDSVVFVGRVRAHDNGRRRRRVQADVEIGASTVEKKKSFIEMNERFRNPTRREVVRGTVVSRVFPQP